MLKNSLTPLSKKNYKRCVDKSRRTCGQNWKIEKLKKEYCKENCIDRSVIEPIIIDFCDDDSDDDTGWNIIILSIIDRGQL
jgi:hypothetical protein